VSEAAERMRAFVAAAPMAAWLGFSASKTPEGFLYRLGFNDAQIGNPAIRALHGGVIAAFLELAMQAELSARTGFKISSVNLAIDYLASSRPEDMTGKVRVLREGRRVAFVEAAGWQAADTKLVAIARCCLKLG